MPTSSISSYIYGLLNCRTDDLFDLIRPFFSNRVPILSEYITILPCTNLNNLGPLLSVHDTLTSLRKHHSFIESIYRWAVQIYET